MAAWGYGVNIWEETAHQIWNQPVPVQKNDEVVIRRKRVSSKCLMETAGSKDPAPWMGDRGKGRLSHQTVKFQIRQENG